MTADRIAFAVVALAAIGTAVFALTRDVCPYCRTRYANWRAVQHHIKGAHRE